MTTTLPLLVEVEVVRHLSRGERLHEPGSQLRLPFDEAASLIRTGFAKPLGAPHDFGHVRQPGWMRAWRK